MISQRAKILAVLCLLIFSLFASLYKITENPPGLYTDEVSVGQNSYSILRTGKDEFGTPFPLWFPAFGEYKLPLHIYLTTIPIALLGKTELAVRIIPAIMGTISILLLFLIVLNLKNFSTAFLSALVFTFSPWRYQFSRIGFEALTALCLYLAALLLFIFFLKKKKTFYLLISLLSLILTLYTYNTYRLITPLLFISFFIYLFLKCRQRIKAALMIGIIAFIVSIPFWQFCFSPQGLARFRQTSAFREIPVTNPLAKAAVYPIIYLTDYFAYYSPVFLFATGDGIIRHQVDSFGPLFRSLSIFVPIGLFMLWKRRREELSLLTGYLFVTAPMTAAVANPTPHILRSLPMSVSLAIIIALGINACFYRFSPRLRIIFFSLCLLIFLFEVSSYLHLYFNHYRKNHTGEWGGGYKEMTLKTVKYAKNYRQVVLASDFTYARIYFLFYTNHFPLRENSHKVGILYVTADTNGKKKPPGMLIDKVVLPNPNHDIFAQFWEVNNE